MNSVLAGGAERAQILGAPSIMDNFNINFHLEIDK